MHYVECQGCQHCTYVYGIMDLSTSDLMRPDLYSRPRDLVPMPWRQETYAVWSKTYDGIPTVSPKTDAAKRHQEAYALRAELGDRAYDLWTGKARKRTKAPAKAPAKSRKLIGDYSESDLRQMLAAAERSKAGVIVMGKVD